MSIDELLAAGRQMSPAQRIQTLRSLCADPRMAALLAHLEAAGLAYVRHVSGQAFAAHPGPLAHGLGSYYALDRFLDELRQLTAPPRPKPEPGAEAEPV